MMKSKIKLTKYLKLRTIIQTFSAVFINGYGAGFVKGKIYTGGTKYVCLPVLNCYSCPGATGACPIGAMQSVNGDYRHKISFYVLGLIMLFGVLFGRLICSFLCPFGFIQDLLYKIRTPKFKVPMKIDKYLRWLKYVMLAAVLLLPVLLANKYGIGAPYFCKLVCPAGTLEGGIPLLLTNESLRKTIGFLFNWKIGILVTVLGSSIFIYRPFCKYICPLGAFYSLFNKVSFWRMEVDRGLCTGCKRCESICKMNVEITKNINSTECIRCGECKSICPQEAISSKFDLKLKQEGIKYETFTNKKT